MAIQYAVCKAVHKQRPNERDANVLLDQNGQKRKFHCMTANPTAATNVTTRNLAVCYSRGCRIVVRGCEFWISVLGPISVTLSGHSRTRLSLVALVFSRRRSEWWHEIPYVTDLNLRALPFELCAPDNVI